MKIIRFTFEKDHCAVGFRELGESRGRKTHFESIIVIQVKKKMRKTSTKARTVRMKMKGQTQNRIRGRIYRFWM